MTHSLAHGPEAARAYVRFAGPHLEEQGETADWHQATAEYLDAGVMNYVYRVRAGDRTFYLKQALDRVKEHGRLGPDLAGVSPARIRVEARALEVLRARLPQALRGRVPRPVWHDTNQNILWTEELAPDAVSLQARLQAGECDPSAAAELGRLLAAVHRAELGDGPLWPTRPLDEENWLRFLRMRTTGFLQRAELPAEAAALAEELYIQARQRERPAMISHLDAAPKNVLLTREGAAILDFELGAAVSDPAYDPGFLAGHYLLMGENLPRMTAASRTAARALVNAYRQAGAGLDTGWETRVWRYAALTMLYRLYGSSPAPYLSPERYNAIRQAGISLLLDPESLALHV